MWVIFRDPKTAFNHPDKYVFEMVADEDILTYQKQMGNGHVYEIMTDIYFLQPFFRSKDDVEYFARKYKTWHSQESS
jgi:hypothetical protein